MPQKTLEALVTEDPVDPRRFTAAFLSHVPKAQITQIIRDLKRRHGRLLGVELSGTDFALRFERAEIPARIVLDGDGKIAGLWFGPAQIVGDFESLVATIKALPGRTSLLITTDGKAVVSHDAEAPLAVGSAAKLAILLALKRAVDDKCLAWDGVVTLDPGWKSLPSGQLQDWPDGTPLTIATLAHLMIAISDNTATDALIHTVGRVAVEAVTSRNAPFLTTREFFVLKATPNVRTREEWQKADAEGRRAMLTRIDALPLPRPEALDTKAGEIEWFFSARELCALLDATADMPSLGINAGPNRQGDWRSVAYKGGSESGVLNLSSRNTDREGRSHCMVATWNGDGPLDQNRLIDPYRAIGARLATRKG